MNVKPLGDRVVLKQAEVEEKIKGFYGDNLVGFAGSKRNEYGYHRRSWR